MFLSLSEKIENSLPQTQCTKCGYQGCQPYSEAIEKGEANYNQCPPGGQEGVARIARILKKPVIPLNLSHGKERVRAIAKIDESICIGCTLCIQACPIDVIIGSAKMMHTVLTDECTGCDLCVAPCPVDCIEMVPISGLNTGWNAWSQSQADHSKKLYQQKQNRIKKQNKIFSQETTFLDEKGESNVENIKKLPLIEKENISSKQITIKAAILKARLKRAVHEEKQHKIMNNE